MLFLAPLLVLYALAAPTQNVLGQSVWLSTSDGEVLTVTPTVIDGVTISASPVTSKATPWVLLDGSGIPYAVTPTVTGGSTILALPTPTASSYPSADAVPPVLRCFGDRVPLEDTQGYPFCTALNGSEWLVGETYWVTWDPSYFGTSISRVSLQMRALPAADNDTPLWTSDYISNADGYYPLEVTLDMIRLGDLQYFFLNITPLTTSTTTATNVGTKAGPVLAVVRTKTAGITTITRVPSDNASSVKASSKSSSNAKTIVPAVVVPVVVVMMLAAGAYYYLVVRKNAKLADAPVNLEGSRFHDAASTVNTVNTLETEATGNPFSNRNATPREVL